MQITAATPLREHEKPMSWARAIVIATGFFFLTAILIGQLPSFFFKYSTNSTLAIFEQTTLDLGLLALGVGILCFEISFLYDPKPLIPWPLFALAGLGIAVVGLFLDYQVGVGPNASGIFGTGWSELQPNSGYLLNPAWFQPGSIDLAALGLIALLIGCGMFGFAVLTPWVLSGRALTSPLRTLIVRFGIGLSFVLVALYLTIVTLLPTSANPFIVRGVQFDGSIGNVQSPAANILLFIALGSALAAIQVWLLPVMVSRRQHFMPGVYLHGVVGLIGAVAVPLLLIWLLTYPVVNLIHQADTAQFWVQCSQKTEIPGSCTFSPFTGYIICTIVFSLTFGLLVAGLYFWNKRRDMVVLGGTIGLIYVALAVTVVHVNDATQTPFGLLIAASIVIVAFFWTWATQHEFASTRAEQLGCTGQWLVLGTLLLIYLFGFAVFSIPNFYEIEALALFYTPGQPFLHDAFWVALLMGGAGALQMTFLVKKRPMSNLRKFALWMMIFAVVLMLMASIQGFKTDLFSNFPTSMGAPHAIFITGLAFGLIGLIACLYGAFTARSLPWAVAIFSVAFVFVCVAIVTYVAANVNNTSYAEVIEASLIIALAGGFAYTAAGPDPDYVVEELAALSAANGNGNAMAAPTACRANPASHPRICRRGPPPTGSRASRRFPTPSPTPVVRWSLPQRDPPHGGDAHCNRRVFVRVSRHPTLTVSLSAQLVRAQHLR